MNITFNSIEVIKMSPGSDNMNSVDSPLREGINEVKAGEITLTRNVNLGKNDSGGNHYQRQYITFVNLPELAGCSQRCFIEGLKVVAKAFYKGENWNELDVIDWNDASPAIETELSSRDSKAYQGELTATIARFVTMCEFLAEKRGKDIKLYKPFIGLLKQTKQIETISPARLEALRSLWSAFLNTEKVKHKEHQLSGDVPRPVQNLNRGVWFDRFDAVTVSDDELADLV